MNSISFNSLNKSVWFIGLLALLGAMFIGSIGCSSKSNSSSSGGSPGTSNIIITGLLTSGTVTLTTTKMLPYNKGQIQGKKASLINTNLSPLGGAPLAGYQLYCVTFGNPPVAGTGTADSSGNVSVTFNAKSTPFGCFILDQSGNGVATLIFTNTTSGQTGQTVSFGGDENLGVITVDLTNGVAQANLPANGTLTTTPSGTPCPVGTWTMGAPSTTCTSEHLDFWIAQSPSSQYVFSYTHYGCYGTDSQSNIPMTYSGGMISGTFNPTVNSSAPYCSGTSMKITFTPNSSCTTMTGQFVVSGVTQCGTSFGGCGSQTCPAVTGLTATKQ